MFTGFPSTNTPNVKWWNFQNSSTGTTSISLDNDCAPIQYFATGGSTTSINLYLPACPAEGKTITISNMSYTTSSIQNIQIYSSASNNTTLITLGSPQSITLCFISQNTQVTANGRPTQWVSIGNTGLNNTFQGNSWAGGTNNKITESASVISGGTGNSISGANSFIGGGNLNTAFNSAVVGGGTSNSAGGITAAVCGGISNAAGGQAASIIGGSTNNADAYGSAVLGGKNGTTRSIVGNIVSAASQGPVSNSSGISQLAMLILGKETTGATATVLVSDSNAAAATNQITLPNNSAYYFRGEVIAGVTGAGDTKGWYIEGVIKRGANAASTVLVGTPTVTSLYADAGAATWAVAVTANVTLGCITITVTGVAATTIRWVAQIRTTEMTY
jgi:hypothetical protein